MPKLDNCIYFKAKAIFCIVWQMSYALWRNQWEISGILHVNSKARKWRHESDKTQTNKPEWGTIFLKHFLKQPVFLEHIFEPKTLPRFPLVLADRAGVEWASSGLSSFAFYFQASRASLFQTAGYLVFLKPYPVAGCVDTAYWNVWIHGVVFHAEPVRNVRVGSFWRFPEKQTNRYLQPKYFSSPFQAIKIYGQFFNQFIYLTISYTYAIFYQ